MRRLIALMSLCAIVAWAPLRAQAQTIDEIETYAAMTGGWPSAIEPITPIEEVEAAVDAFDAIARALPPDDVNVAFFIRHVDAREGGGRRSFWPLMMRHLIHRPSLDALRPSERAALMELFVRARFANSLEQREDQLAAGCVFLGALRPASAPLASEAREAVDGVALAMAAWFSANQNERLGRARLQREARAEGRPQPDAAEYEAFELGLRLRSDAINAYLLGVIDADGTLLDPDFVYFTIHNIGRRAEEAGRGLGYSPVILEATLDRLSSEERAALERARPFARAHARLLTDGAFEDVAALADAYCQE